MNIVFAIVYNGVQYGILFMIYSKYFEITVMGSLFFLIIFSIEIIKWILNDQIKR